MITGEFIYDSLKEINGVTFHLGRCVSGVIKVNDVFHNENSNPVLQVVEIHQINKKVEELPEGMTAGLLVRRLDESSIIFSSGKVFVVQS